MRCVVIISCLLLQTQIFSQQCDREQYRLLLLRAFDHKTALDSLAHKLEAIEHKTPAEESYYGMCNALYCQYDDGNMAKLKHLMKSRNYLNNAVDRDPGDPELHFLRLVLEHFIPAFLGMSKHIPDDLQVIFANLNFIDNNPCLKKKVVEFLIYSKRCNPQQEQILQRQLSELNSNAPALMAKNNGRVNSQNARAQGIEHQ